MELDYSNEVDIMQQDSNQEAERIKKLYYNQGFIEAKEKHYSKEEKQQLIQTQILNNNEQVQSYQSTFYQLGVLTGKIDGSLRFIQSFIQNSNNELVSQKLDQLKQKFYHGDNNYEQLSEIYNELIKFRESLKNKITPF